MKNTLAFWVLILLAIACSQDTTSRETADKLYFNGTILTMEGDKPTYVEAVATKGKKILKTGQLTELKKWVGEKTESVDLEGNTMLPGFVEPHLHPTLATLLIQTEIIAFNDWNLPHGAFKGVRNQTEYLKKLNEVFTRHKNTAVPIITWGYHELYHGTLGRKTLDSLYGEQPLLIWQYSFHEVILNSDALDFFKIDEAAAEKHPQVDIQAGRFYEKGLHKLVAPQLIPYLLQADKSIRGIQLTAQAIKKGGVTTVADMAMPLINLDLELNLVKKGLNNPLIPFRTFLIPMASAFAQTPVQLDTALVAIENLLGQNTEKVQFVRQVKLMADGAFYAQLMQMSEPYTDGHHGEWLTEPEEFKKFADFFWKNDFKIHVHVNGDLGLEMVLNTLEELQQKKPVEDHRFTLHHLGYFRKDQAERMAKLGVHASLQPYYLYSLGSKYSENGLGPNRAARISPAGYLIENEVLTSFHSDFFMAPVEPLTLVWVAVNRKTLDDKVLGPELRISVWEALKAVTLNAAVHLNQEALIGSIRDGKYADFVILDQNPLTIKPESIKDVKIIATVFEGQRF